MARVLSAIGYLIIREIRVIRGQILLFRMEFSAISANSARDIKKRRPVGPPLSARFNSLFRDIDFVDLGLLAGSTGEQVLGSDDSSALITLDLLNPELHC